VAVKRILVLGSLNVDLVQRVARIPFAGETLKGGSLEIFVGGKGANQACAAARLGARVRMAGMLGTDVFSARVLAELQDMGVDTTSIVQSEGACGSAVIFVLPNGENSIVISPGANARVSVDFAIQALEGMEAGDLLLCQLEIPMPAVEAGLREARRRNFMTMLDPAPAASLSEELLAWVDILTPNQIEAAVLTGLPTPPSNMSEAEHCARELIRRGANTVIVKMGEQGCLLAGAGGCHAVPGFRVPVADTTAAGDTLNGALAAALARDCGIIEALVFANAAAALSVTKPGAISSIPARSEVDDFLRLAGPAR
jgi:ribokinase